MQTCSFFLCKMFLYWQIMRVLLWTPREKWKVCLPPSYRNIACICTFAYSIILYLVETLKFNSHGILILLSMNAKLSETNALSSLMCIFNESCCLSNNLYLFQSLQVLPSLVRLERSVPICGPGLPALQMPSSKKLVTVFCFLGVKR